MTERTDTRTKGTKGRKKRLYSYVPNQRELTLVLQLQRGRHGDGRGGRHSQGVHGRRACGGNAQSPPSQGETRSLRSLSVAPSGHSPLSYSSHQSTAGCPLASPPSHTTGTTDHLLDTGLSPDGCLLMHTEVFHGTQFSHLVVERECHPFDKSF